MLFKSTFSPYHQCSPTHTLYTFMIKPSLRHAISQFSCRWPRPTLHLPVRPSSTLNAVYRPHLTQNIMKPQRAATNTYKTCSCNVFVGFPVECREQGATDLQAVDLEREVLGAWRALCSGRRGRGTVAPPRLRQRYQGRLASTLDFTFSHRHSLQTHIRTYS